jgi:hypothetical protein
VFLLVSADEERAVLKDSIRKIAHEGVWKFQVEYNLGKGTIHVT